MSLLKIFTWHIHGSYLYYLSQGNYQLYLPVNATKQAGYYGRGNTFPFGENVIEVPMHEIKNTKFDCILYQSEKNYLIDQYEVLTQAQRKLPRIYLEHNTPSGHACNSRHVVNDPDVTLVHVTHFNKLMWNSNSTLAQVIEHGVKVPDIPFSGDIPRGIVVINNLPARGRIAGFDLFLDAMKELPVDLAGMGTETLGLGEVLHPHLPEFLSRYRFYFHPTRWTSLGLSLLESMMIGMPVIGLATTELPLVIKNGVSGFFDTDINALLEKMKLLIDDKTLAIQMGEEARKTAIQRFNIQRFTSDWEQLFQSVTQASRKHTTHERRLKPA
jgi:glycosyltransferase involved in cell wall biosynthesis